jgi:hypothetical protein
MLIVLRPQQSEQGIKRMARLRSTLALALLAAAATAHAQGYGSSYDWQSGNQYNWNTIGNQTNVQGYNIKNGTRWNTTIQPNGSMTGYDGNGNYWQYDSNSGNYYNYGTGTMCTGKGAFRVCN